jgi:hypothetical protein
MVFFSHVIKFQGSIYIRPRPRLFSGLATDNVKWPTIEIKIPLQMLAPTSRPDI